MANPRFAGHGNERAATDDRVVESLLKPPQLGFSTNECLPIQRALTQACLALGSDGLHAQRMVRHVRCPR